MMKPIRGLMHEAALKVDADPDRLSFLHAVRVIRRKLPLAVAILLPRARTAFHQALLAELATAWSPAAAAGRRAGSNAR